MKMLKCPSESWAFEHFLRHSVTRVRLYHQLDFVFLN